MHIYWSLSDYYYIEKTTYPPSGEPSASSCRGKIVVSLLSLCMAKWLRKWRQGWLYVRSNTHTHTPTHTHTHKKRKVSIIHNHMVITLFYYPDWVTPIVSFVTMKLYLSGSFVSFLFLFCFALFCFVLFCFVLFFYNAPVTQRRDAFTFADSRAVKRIYYCRCSNYLNSDIGLFAGNHKAKSVQDVRWSSPTCDEIS